MGRNGGGEDVRGKVENEEVGKMVAVVECKERVQLRLVEEERESWLRMSRCIESVRLRLGQIALRKLVHQTRESYSAVQLTCTHFHFFNYSTAANHTCLHTCQSTPPPLPSVATCCPQPE